MSARVAARLAWALFGLSAALLAGEVIFAILNRSIDLEGSYGLLFDSLFRLALLIFPIVGALVASRRPENPIGWLFLGAGVLLALSGFAYGWAAHTLFVDPGVLPAGDVMAWLSAWVFIPALFGTTALLFLLFPSGRYAGRRWRLVGWLTIAGTLAAALGPALRPGRLEEPPFEGVVNPFGLESAERVVDVAATIGWIALVASIPVAAVGMLLRLRRARGLERQQLKWIAGAAALFALACLGAATAFAAGHEHSGQIAILVAYAAIPLAAGQAILRHRLYDIDVVINRTLVYGSVTALLAGAYLGLVLLFQFALSPITEQSGLAVALSTLAVAALFRPARDRVQALVDRRFYRRKYDAQRTLEGFSARLRRVDDPDALRAEVTGVIARSMQPAHVSLWLRARRHVP